MKKLFTLLLILIISLPSFSQDKFSYKVGLMASLSTGSSKADETKVSLGSTLIEVNYAQNEQIRFTGNTGYIRYANGGESYAQIPLLIGAKYIVDDVFYFGAAFGFATYVSTNEKSNFQYSPHIGANIRKLSVDIRYINTSRKNQSRSTSLVLSYNL